jgi:hypothetical protein
MTDGLPAEVEQVINDLCWYCLPYDASSKPNWTDAASNLRATIQAALADRDADIRALAKLILESREKGYASFEVHRTVDAIPNDRLKRLAGG